MKMIKKLGAACGVAVLIWEIVSIVEFLASNGMWGDGTLCAWNMMSLFF